MELEALQAAASEVCAPAGCATRRAAPPTITRLCFDVRPPHCLYAQIHQQNDALQNEVDELLAELGHITTSAQATSASLHKVRDAGNAAHVLERSH